MKRILSLFLCLIMLCTIIPSSVFADDGDFVPLTEAEVIATADLSWDISEAQDGSITMYLVPNGDETYSLYAFGAGPMQEISASSRADVLAKYPWCAEALPVTTAYIGDGITTIGRCLFFGATIESVRIPSSVMTIGDQAFRATKIKSIDIPDSVTAIGENCFVYNYDLETISLPNGITEISDGSFVYCTSLKTIDIPASVTTIGTNCFQNCDALQSINVAEENQNYCSHDGILYNKEITEIIAVPLGISGMIEIPYGVTRIESSAFSGCENMTSVEIPDSVTYIGQSAFNATGLTYVEIPASVTQLERSAFAHCYDLQTITVDPNNPNYCNDEYGVLFNKNKTTLYSYPTGLTLTEYEIPSSVTYIMPRSFAGNPYLTGTITIPESCGVGSGAFSGMRNIDKIIWKTAPKTTNAYVHENMRPVCQGRNNACTHMANSTAIATLANDPHMDFDYWISVVFDLCPKHGNAGVTDFPSMYDAYGIDYTVINKPKNVANYKEIVAEALSEGKMAIVSVNMRTGVPGATGNSQHVYCVYGISDEGYLYIYDPSYPDAPMTQFDPELLYNAKDSSNIYLLDFPKDISMKTTEIQTEATATTYPGSCAFEVAEGEKLGVTNGDGTYLTKTSGWTNYQSGTASTSLRFAYEPEAVDYIYVLDYSDSMTLCSVDEDYTTMSIEKTLAYNSIEDLLCTNPESRVSVVTFKGQNEASFTAFTSDSEDLRDTIANEKCQGFTCFADGFNAAMDAMESRTGDDANRKTVVVFASDGNQNMWVNENDLSCTTYLERYSKSASGNTNYGVEEAATLRAAGAEIYAVVLNPNISDTAAAKMAEITDDEDKVFVAGTVEELGEAFCSVIDAATLRSFTITDTIGSDFNFYGNLTAADGTTAVIDEANRTITWTLENILPNTEYTLSFDIQSKKDSSGQFVCGDLPTNLGNAVVKEGDIVVNEVETPVLHRDPVLVDDGAQAHMIHKYTDLKRADNPALYTDGIRFVMDLDMKELQDTYEPGDKLAFGIAMLPLNKLQNGQTTSYLTMNVGTAGQLSSNGSYSFVNNTSAISSSKKLAPANMITWTEAMENCATPAAFAKLLKAAGMNIFDVTDTGIQYSVYMMFSNANTRQAQADREIAYRGIMVSYDAQNGYAVKYSFQRNNSATRIYNHYNCINYNVINVKGATAADMLHGESEYNPSYEAQAAAQ